MVTTANDAGETAKRLPPRFFVSVSRQFTNSRSLVFPCPYDRERRHRGLREKREEINQQITDEEDEKSKVQSDLTVLSKRLTTLNDSIARKVRTRETKLPFTSARSIGRTIFCWKNARVAARCSPYHHPLPS